ncbi:hypothetical protein V5799_025294 [Amblyomma americanum]|uniref:Tick transposon n=1 Tax=Amblyomma americanum TaxID=6943 RepID=A0AAQ4E9Z4_AMBAM
MKLLNLREKRDHAERRARRTDRASDWTVYNRLDAAARRHANKLYRRQWASLCQRMEEDVNSRRLFDTLRRITEPQANRQPLAALAIFSGLSFVELAERFADRFAPPSPANSANIAAPESPRSDASPSPVALEGPCDAPFTAAELNNALQRCHRRSAPGPDGVTRQMLRNLDAQQRHGELLEDWQTAVVCPIRKAGRPPTELNEYRPVALTSAAGAKVDHALTAASRMTAGTSTPPVFRRATDHAPWPPATSAAGTSGGPGAESQHHKVQYAKWPAENMQSCGEKVHASQLWPVDTASIWQGEEPLEKARPRLGRSTYPCFLQQDSV